MKYLYLLLLCFPLLLDAQSEPPSRLQRATTLHSGSTEDSKADSTKNADQQLLRPAGKEASAESANFEAALRKLGPDLITPRLTINTDILEKLLELLEVQPDVRLVLAIDHNALSVRYALVHKLLEDLEAYPVVKSRVDVEMYAPISKYHTTWLYSRRLGHLMIRLERLSR